MRILVVSDSHRNNEKLYRAVSSEKAIDCMIHCGDIECDERIVEQMADYPVYIVAGNNDYFYDLQQEIEIELAGKKFFITHGHYYYVSMSPQRIIEEAHDRKADVVVFGHTHRPMLMEDDGMLVLNPGSVAYPRQEKRRCSYAVIEISEIGDIDCEIKYLE